MERSVKIAAMNASTSLRASFMGRIYPAAADAARGHIVLQVLRMRDANARGSLPLSYLPFAFAAWAVAGALEAGAGVGFAERAGAALAGLVAVLVKASLDDAFAPDGCGWVA